MGATLSEEMARRKSTGDAVGGRDATEEAVKRELSVAPAVAELLVHPEAVAENVAPTVATDADCDTVGEMLNSAVATVAVGDSLGEALAVVVAVADVETVGDEEAETSAEAEGPPLEGDALADTKTLADTLAVVVEVPSCVAAPVGLVAERVGESVNDARTVTTVAVGEMLSNAVTTVAVTLTEGERDAAGDTDDERDPDGEPLNEGETEGEGVKLPHDDVVRVTDGETLKVPHDDAVRVTDGETLKVLHDDAVRVTDGETLEVSDSDVVSVPLVDTDKLRERTALTLTALLAEANDADTDTDEQSVEELDLDVCELGLVLAQSVAETQVDDDNDARGDALKRLGDAEKVTEPLELSDAQCETDVDCEEDRESDGLALLLAMAGWASIKSSRSATRRD